MKRKWSCFPTNKSYIFKLEYGKITLAKEISKDSFYHTLNTETYFQYHIIQLNEALKKELLPLTRDLQVGRRIQ